MTLAELTGLNTTAVDIIAIALAAAVSALLVCALVLGVIRLIREAKGGVPQDTIPEEHKELTRIARRAIPRESTWRTLLLCLLAAVISRLALYIIAWLADVFIQDGSLYLITQIPKLFSRADAPHYLGIAEFGYRTVGDPRFHIVFFPLFPWITRAFWYIIGNYFWASILFNTLCTAGSMYAMILLARLDAPHDEGRRAALMMMLWPMAFFLAAPYTEALSLLCTLSLLYLCRKKRFFAAAVFGFLGALTRSTGVVAIVPFAVEALLDAIKSSDKHRWQKLIGRALLSLLIPLGTGVYVFVNWRVTGNPFQFLIYQSEHWSQRMGDPFSTVRYTVQNLFSFDTGTALTVWLPQLAATIFAAITLVIGNRKQLCSSLALYGAVYLIATLMPTWLLSEPRYLLLLAPMFLVMGRWMERRATRVAAVLLCGALQIAYLSMYAMGWAVY